jgi:hypothetical protein
MDFLNQTRFIERLQFFDNQRLFANDLQSLEAFNREMRWLHNRSLHQPGIGNGLAVAGRKGEREVVIGPGYAIDAEGREIALTQNVVEPVPPVAGEDDGGPALFDLTISYPDDAFLEETERRAGICRQPGGAIRLQEKPVFCWVRLKENGQPLDDQLKSEIAAGMRLVLARAEVLNCQLNKDISIAQRISARPARQPYVCCGTTKPDWRPWVFTQPEANLLFTARDSGKLATASFERLRVCPFILPIGLEAEIDTSQCGFLTTPCYSARIDGPRIKSIARPGAGLRVALGSAIVATGNNIPIGNVVMVNDASPFRVGDVVTKDNTARAAITGISNNIITLNAALPGLAFDNTLRIANIPPAQATFRLTSVSGLQPNGRAELRGLDPAGNVVSDRVIIQSVNSAANTVTLAATPARANTYKLDVAADQAPMLIPEQTFSIVIDGLTQIINPMPDKFTVQVLLLVQLPLPESGDGKALNFAALTSRKATRRQAAQVQDAAQKFITDTFSDWQLVWMGVEG